MATRIILIIISFGIVISLSSQDTDGDGYDACPSMNPDISTCDCDDSDPNIYPGSPTPPYEGGVICWTDADGDGWGINEIPITTCLTCPSGYANQSGDCDDDNININPGQAEIMGNGIDEDCDCMPDNPTTPPANDDWTNADSISIGVDVSGDTYAADLGSGDTTSCGFDEKVVWYKFVATSTTHSIDFLYARQHCNAPTSTAKAILHTESGGSLTGVSCPGDLNQCNNFTGQHQYTCLTIGTTYYMSVGFRRTNPYVQYTFAIDRVDSPIALDDVCDFQSSDVINLSLDTIQIKFYDLDGATTQENEPAPEEIVTGACDDSQNRWCDNELNGTIWIPITLSTSGKITIAAGNSTATRLALYDGINCNTTFDYATLITANDNLGAAANISADCLEAGKMYWLQVDLEDGASSTDVVLSFGIQNATCSIQDPSTSVSCGSVAIDMQESVGTGDWMHFYGDLTSAPGDDPSILVSVNDMGHSLGTVSVNVQNHAGASYRSYESNPYIDRNFSINVDHQPTMGDSVHVRFYFPTSYINDFLTDQGLLSPYDMVLIKCTSIVCVCGDFIGLGDGHPVIATGLLASDEITYLEFRIAEFSSFYFFDQRFDPCPDTQILSQSINNKYYQAYDSIATSGTTSIQDTSTLIAGNLIQLNQKFSVDQGKVFEAQIGDCRN